MLTTSPTVTTAPGAQAKRETPNVLVGIVTHDRSAILPKAIQTALAQAYPSVELFVVDDASSDATPQLRRQFPEVQWLRWDATRGYLEARNLMMQTAKADYFVSLDDDAWFIKEDEIAVAVQYMERNPHVAAVAFDILTPDRTRPVPRTEPLPVSMFIGCGHVLRLTAAREADFYEPNPGFYGSEERDLCIRLLNRNWEVRLLPGVHVWHDKTSVARDQPAQHRSGVCNDLVFAFRRCPFPLLIAVFPIKVINHLRFALRHRLLKPCLSGIALFLRSSPHVWETRRPVRGSVFREFLLRSRETQ